MNPLPLLRFFLRLPVIAFRIAGLVRITNRARRGFRRVLKDEGLPEDVVDELFEKFNPMKPLKDLVLSWESFRQ